MLIAVMLLVMGATLNCGGRAERMPKTRSGLLRHSAMSRSWAFFRTAVGKRDVVVNAMTPPWVSALSRPTFTFGSKVPTKCG